MTRGTLGQVALLCLGVLGGGACASRPEATPPKEEPRREETAMPTTETPAATARTLECALSGPATVKAGQPVEVLFRLTNRTSAPLYVLDWHTPLEGIRNNIFEVTRDGTEVPYIGEMMKRGAPQADDYVTVAPGATVEGKVDLSRGYDLRQPGRYRVAFINRLMDVATDKAAVPPAMGEFREAQVTCPPFETTVTP
ncbi:protease [Pyxidicoccus fallax]|uniref:Protease n=1 Tax=Pyxidicoccus fallax TaxID=394095 RepID=A0A848LZA5_9BACT|nr:protease [Pyxidicoccus fallax]NMO22484.1 protease [Pyxidicoccus fallax]NPC86304.1 protease [Pyxidicoccus fallax]